MFEAKSTLHSKMKVADLTSGAGALILGIGLGAYFYDRVGKYAILLFIIGAVSHSWGMYDKNRIEKRLTSSTVWWEKVFYWLCWILLLLAVLILFIEQSP